MRLYLYIPDQQGFSYQSVLFGFRPFCHEFWKELPFVYATYFEVRHIFSIYFFPLMFFTVVFIISVLRLKPLVFMYLWLGILVVVDGFLHLLWGLAVFFSDLALEAPDAPRVFLSSFGKQRLSHTPVS